MLTHKFTEAFTYAATIHAAQQRKGTEIPYLSHLMAVAGLVLEHADPASSEYEDLAIAALLHDAGEDQGGERRIADIEGRFDKRVADLVRKCSDSLTEDPAHKRPWGERKRAYLEHLRGSKDRGYLLVGCADKVHNARAILTDLRTHGDGVWARFKGKAPAQIIGYYLSLATVYEEQLLQTHPLARELATATASIWAESGEEADTKWARE